MLPELSEIKTMRKKLNITQTELAKQTGISQSLIAKTESNDIVPSYANAKKLFDYFEMLQQKHGTKASNVMTAKVISVRTDTSIKQAIKTMEKNSVSQLPVINDGMNLGMVSEKSILEKINQSGNTQELLEKNVETIMEEAMPQVSEETPFDAISSLTGHNTGVLVVKKGKITGIITKSDLLKAVLAKK
ncbi:MAG TPA: CBS domain-containing protein [archaeon]|nr:CBS domain-containing protein [archaeon]